MPEKCSIEGCNEPGEQKIEIRNTTDYPVKSIQQVEIKYFCDTHSVLMFNALRKTLKEKKI